MEHFAAGNLDEAENIFLNVRQSPLLSLLLCSSLQHVICSQLADILTTIPNPLTNLAVINEKKGHVSSCPQWHHHNHDIITIMTLMWR